MSIETDAEKWKSCVSKIKEIDPDGLLLTEGVKKYFDEVAEVFKRNEFNAENTRKQLKILRGRNTKLTGKPISVELSSFVNITERYATKTEEIFGSFTAALGLTRSSSTRSSSTRSRSEHQSPIGRNRSAEDDRERTQRMLEEREREEREREQRARAQREEDRRAIDSTERQIRELERRLRSPGTITSESEPKPKPKKKKRGCCLGFVIIFLLLGLIGYFAGDGEDKEKVFEYGKAFDSRDNSFYKTISIGGQVWLAENVHYGLNESTLASGNRFYTYEQALQVCPEGFALPSLRDYEVLFEHIGGKAIAGKKLKGYHLWQEDIKGVNIVGFSATPTGFFSFKDSLTKREKEMTGFWTETAEDTKAFRIKITKDDEGAFYEKLDKRYGFSVRCIAKATPLHSGDSFVVETAGEEVQDEIDSPPVEESIEDQGEISSVEEWTDSRDSKKYRTLAIGSSVWFLDNMNFVTDSSFCYDDEYENCESLGRLYSWGDAMEVCPSPWRLPTEIDWGNIEDNIVELSKNPWDSDFFDAKAGGYRSKKGNYDLKGFRADFWSSGEFNEKSAYYFYFQIGEKKLSKNKYGKSGALSVRCVKDK